MINDLIYTRIYISKLNSISQPKFRLFYKPYLIIINEVIKQQQQQQVTHLTPQALSSLNNLNSNNDIPYTKS